MRTIYFRGGRVNPRMRKTRAGLPRPLAPYEDRMLPVPWNLDGTWSTTDPDRVARLKQSVLCQVCGKKLGARAVFVLDAETGDILDEGGLHNRCARLAMAHCPFLRDPLSLHWKFNDVLGGLRMVTGEPRAVLEMKPNDRLALPDHTMARELVRSRDAT